MQTTNPQTTTLKKKTNLLPSKQFKNASLLAILISVSACLFQPKPFFEQNQTLPQKGWDYEDTVTFQVDISDTTALYNIYINLRHTDSYAYANSWIFVKTIFPDNTSKQAPINLPLANDNGKWYGTGTGDLISNQTLIQEYAKLPQMGKYTFEITQHMRTNPLQDLQDIGLILKKAP